MTPDEREIAAEVLAAFDAGRQVDPYFGRIAGFDNGFTYGIAAELRRIRTTRGERLVGRKIGFTNRNIWTEYQVFEPIWGDVYDGWRSASAPAQRR